MMMDITGGNGRESSSQPSSRGLGGRTSSQEFAEQIHQLEVEGSKLMQATNHLGDSLGVRTTVRNDSARIGSSSYRATSSSLSALADISSSEKAIAEIRSQLDAQSNEARRLQRTLHSDPLGLGASTTSGPYSETLSALDIPLSTTQPLPNPTLHTTRFTEDPTALTLSALSTGRPRSSAYVPESHLDRQLRQAQEEIADLRTRLREVVKISEQQKTQFRQQIEDLKTRLQDSLQAQESLAQLKDKVSTSGDLTVRRLQSTVTQLEQANRLQEETLLELNSKLEGLQKEKYVVDSVVSQVRNLLVDREKQRGRMFYDTEPISSQSTTMLLHTLERCVQELEAESQSRQRRINELQKEMDKDKATTEERLQMTVRQYQDRLSHEKVEHEKQLAASVELSQTTRDQLSSLQDQLAVIQSQHQEKLASREEEYRELETRLHRATLDHEQEKASWTEKKLALEHALDEMQKEATVCRSERDEAIQKHSCIESRFDSVQETITQLENDLQTERQNCDRLMEEKGEMEDKITELKNQLNTRSADAVHLRQALDDMKHEAQSQLKQTVASLEKEGKERAADQLNVLATQLTTLTDKYQQVALQHEVLKTDHKRLAEKYDLLEEQNKQKATILEGIFKDKEALSQELKASETDLDNLRSERDMYYKTLEERNDDISSLRAENEKLTVQLEEREKNLAALQAQTENISSMMETNAESQRNARQERDTLQKQLNDKIIEAQDLRHDRDSIHKKLQVREKHLADMEEDNIRMAELIRERKAELEQVIKEKDSLYLELKQSRYEVAELTQSSKKTQVALDKLAAESKRDIQKLTQKLKSAERDLRLAHKALKAQESVDGKAVKVAGKMQRQVTEKRGIIDNLQTRLHWLEECLEASIKDKKVLQEDNEQLVDSLQKITQQNQCLVTNMTNLKAENQELRAKSSRYDSALEKAAVKYAAAQAQVEQFEQDMARLKLKHQLELKEVQRTGQLSKTTMCLLDGTKTSGLVGSVSGTNTCTSALNSRPVMRQGRAQHTSNPAEPDLPVSQKPTQAQVESLVAQNGVGHELRGLLDEMRALIYGQQQAQEHIRQAARQAHGQTGHHGDEVSKPTKQTEHLTSESKHGTKTDSEFYKQGLEYKAVKKKPLFSKKISKSGRATGSGRSSPVSDLLTADNWQPSDSESVDSHLTEENENYPGVKGLTSLPYDTAALCKRLKKKKVPTATLR